MLGALFSIVRPRRFGAIVMPMRPRLSPLFCALLLAGATHAAPMRLDDYLALRGPPPTATIAYGSAPSQYAELFLPAGAGPFPVAVLVHGGCWTRQFGGIEQLRNLAGALAAEGIAAWSIEYRRVDEDGGGYPGMYQDMNAALAALVRKAPRYRLDTARLVAIGHSAGGQLVQWMAGRARIAPSSPLYVVKPLPVPAVISLGGLADLRHEAGLIKQSCGRDSAELAGSGAQAFKDSNAAELLPTGSRTVLVTGELDNIAPPRVAQAYARRARAAGDRVEVLILPAASHYDEVATTSPAWPLVRQAIRDALGLPR